MGYFENTFRHITSDAGMMCATAQNRAMEWRSTVALYKYNGKTLILRANTWLFFFPIQMGNVKLCFSLTFCWRYG